ncbi:hypothetical protein [uncultured Eubacterium sp.]|uniref:hypothetical protein n=1 Tax=uncultured Eubacterium sp. TaxID=165185 RepID=UPI00262AAA47|nr:hypothetical protein [uncultured Eubacterium sp.]
MKKFIKKTIAGLIAGVMAVSSMPFVALADEYSDFNTMKSQMASFTAYQPSAHGSFSGDKDFTNYEDHYKGLVYAEDVKDYSATGSVQLGSNWTGSNSTYANLYFPTSVALYTDGNEITVPIMISASTARSGTWDCKFRAHSGVISGDGLSLVNSVWNGKDEKTGDKDNCYANGNQTSNLPDMNFMWTINQTSYRLSTDATNSPTNSDIDPGYGIKAQIWANKVKVSPSFSNSTSVETKSYKPEIKFYVTGKGNNIDTGKSITLTSSDAVTVINYQPYLNKLATVKSDVASLNATKCTAASLKTYVDACNEFLNINPSTYAYSSDTTTAVNSLVAAMNKAMTDYDSAKSALKYTYTFVKADGSQTTVEAENDVKALEANKTPNTASTPKTYAGENQHKWTEYTWPETATNYTFTEQATEKSEACNVVDSKCTECGNVFLDLEAWNKAAQEHITITINDISKYTNESMAEYNALADEAIALRNSATTQEDVDKATAMLLSAQTVLRKKSVTVTFVYDNDGNEATHETKTVSYGETYDAVSDKNVEKWTVSTDDGATTTRLNTYDKTVSIVVTKDVVIKAYQTDEEQTEASSKVTFYGKNNVVVAVRYVAKGTELPTNTVGVPKIPFYDEGKWDKETVTGTGSDISVKAVYETTQVEDELCGVHYDGFEGGVKKYSYDSYVYLTGANTTKKYALYSDEARTKLLTILDGIDFYAPKTKDIYVGEYTGEDKASIGITGSFNQRTETPTGTIKSAVYNCKFYLPEGATVVEYGLEVTLNGKTARVKAESKSERNEYSISLNAPITATSITAVDGRAYVTYTLNGKTTTIYSETVNQAL